MKKYILPAACLALFLALQAPTEAKPNDHHDMPKGEPRMEAPHKPPHDRGPHIQVNYRYHTPCRSHHRYECYECCHRPPHGHPDGFFGGRLGFTIFL